MRDTDIKIYSTTPYRTVQQLTEEYRSEHRHAFERRGDYCAAYDAKNIPSRPHDIKRFPTIISMHGRLHDVQLYLRFILPHLEGKKEARNSFNDHVDLEKLLRQR